MEKDLSVYWANQIQTARLVAANLLEKVDSVQTSDVHEKNRQHNFLAHAIRDCDKWLAAFPDREEQGLTTWYDACSLETKMSTAIGGAIIFLKAEGAKAWGLTKS